jgi:predicted small secreted protein
MKKLISAVVFSAVVLTGCNTLGGFGQDVENTGEAISNTAR